MTATRYRSLEACASFQTLSDAGVSLRVTAMGREGRCEALEGWNSERYPAKTVYVRVRGRATRLILNGCVLARPEANPSDSIGSAKIITHADEG